MLSLKQQIMQTPAIRPTYLPPIVQQPSTTATMLPTKLTMYASQNISDKSCNTNILTINFVNIDNQASAI